MSEMKPVNVTDQNARSQSSALKGKQVDGKQLPPEARREVETDLQTQPEQSGKNQEANRTEVENAVAQIQDYMQNMQRDLNFELDDDSGITVIKVFDTETQELIRQIPNEEALTLAQNLNQEEPLGLFSAKV